jgi:CHAT domain-containing protein
MDREAEAVVLNNLSVAYEITGDLTRSLEWYQEVLRLVRASGDSRGEAYALSNIGNLYHILGEHGESRHYLQQALESFERIGDRPAQARTLDNLGATLVVLDRPAEAIGAIERGLAIAREVGRKGQESATLTTLARAHRALGDGARALTLAEQALSVARDADLRNAEATALRTLGEIRLSTDEPAAAIDLLRGALAIQREIGSRLAEAETLFRLARAERALGRLDDARRDLEAAIQKIESVRAAVVAPDLRATYLASKQGYYEEWIGLLMELDREDPGKGWDAQAFAVAERARARTLLDALTEVDAELRSRLEPTLAAEEERLRHRLNIRERERRLAELGGDEEAAAAAAQDLRALAGEYRALEARIRNASPHYADLVQPEPLDAASIQTSVLGPGILLLQYSLGQSESWLWAVTRDSLTAFRLPPRAEIESRARHLYDLLTARNLEPEGETLPARARRIEEADAEIPAAAAALADAVLGPVAPLLTGDRSPRTLVVAADGALHYVPFAALPKPGRETTELLLVDHEVVYVPSASALAVLRRDLKARDPAPLTLAVLADPVFAADDPRVSRLEKDQGTGSPADGAVRGGEGFPRLRFSRDEAKDIAELVPEDERLIAFDFEASRETATDGLLARYRMVHFATHGVLNTDYPSLSGLVLSLVDEEGAPREGFLRLHDIYALDLRADLVTLSACETALGREIRGEGLVGLARGFMYAGAARVVASLWQVQDRATKDTMKRFYEGMIERGLAPAAALREAQIAMSRQERWAAAYYWAPFGLHGEWR